MLAIRKKRIVRFCLAAVHFFEKTAKFHYFQKCIKKFIHIAICFSDWIIGYSNGIRRYSEKESQAPPSGTLPGCVKRGYVI